MAKMVWVPSDTGFVNSKGETGVWQKVEDKKNNANSWLEDFHDRHYGSIFQPKPPSKPESNNSWAQGNNPLLKPNQNKPLAPQLRPNKPNVPGNIFDIVGTSKGDYIPSLPSVNVSGGNGGNGGSWNGGGGGSSGGGYVPSLVEIEEYQSRYQAAIDALMDKILNRGAFSYNPFNDPTYQNYEKQYRKMGELAMEDTLGKLSGKTGGLASSYAASAAQQANNQYMTELAGIIPELEQLAYQMYLQEGNSMINNLNNLINLDNQEYARWHNDLTDRMTYGRALKKRK